jgi:hypothetical protein
MSSVCPKGDSAREASSKAKAKACALAKRSFGSLAKALSTTCSTPTGRVGTFFVKGGGGAKVYCQRSEVADWNV